MTSADPPATETCARLRAYLFRGDVRYKGGPVGAALGAEADAADIQDAADHVLRKELNLTSRFTSFTLEVRVARRFTKSSDNRHVFKVELDRLLALAAEGIVNIWDPNRAYAVLSAGSKKQAKQAADVQAAMERNSEILIEGEIPADAVEWAS